MDRGRKNIIISTNHFTNLFSDRWRHDHSSTVDFFPVGNNPHTVINRHLGFQHFSGFGFTYTKITAEIPHHHIQHHGCACTYIGLLAYVIKCCIIEIFCCHTHALHELICNCNGADTVSACIYSDCIIHSQIIFETVRSGR